MLEQGESLEIAGVRLGVSRSTAEKYRAGLRRTGRLRD